MNVWQGMPFIVVCGKTSWWQTDWLREWVGNEQQTRAATIGLLFCVTSMDSDEGEISAEIEEALKLDHLPIAYLGIWSHLVWSYTTCSLEEHVCSAVSRFHC